MRTYVSSHEISGPRSPSLCRAGVDRTLTGSLAGAGQGFRHRHAGYGACTTTDGALSAWAVGIRWNCKT